jgi:hypothetical protein
MPIVNLDDILWLVGIVAEVAVVGLLLYRRTWRTLPVFCGYCAWVLISDGGNFAIERYFPSTYTTAYLVETIVDSVLEFSVLIELAWSVLRPIRASLPRSALAVVGVLIVGVGAVIWPLGSIHGLAGLSMQLRTLVHMQQTVSILRILFFLLLAGCSQLLSIGWRDRELQVATGLGIYSIVSVAMEILHTHQVRTQQYHVLQLVVGVSYLGSLLYWVFAFATKEAERREFSPQMQHMLLAVAGAARTQRVALEDSVGSKPRKP